MNPLPRGNAILEFTLAGIPLMFVLISVVEMSRGMWLYHTLAFAINEAARYAALHGSDCVTSPHNCPIMISDIAAKIQTAGIGLDQNKLQLTFTSNTRTIGPESLSAAKSDSTNWPTNAYGAGTADAGANAGNPVTVQGTYLFRSAISFFWPGVNRTMVFGAFNMYAISTQRIVF